MAESDAADGDGRGGGVLGAASRLIGWLEQGLNVLAALTIFLVMIGTTLSIATRLAFGYPIPGYLDVSQQAIAVFAFLGVAYAQRLGGHIRMEIVIGGLKGRMRWLLEAAGSLLSLCLVLVLIRYSWGFFLNAYQIGDSTVDYQIPTWPAKLLVPLAFSVWAVRLTVELAGYIRLVAKPGAPPVGIPLTPGAAEQAQREIPVD